MNTEEAFKILKDDFIHTAKGKEAVEVIEKEFRELKVFREHWRESVARAYSEPHKTITEDLDA